MALTLTDAGILGMLDRLAYLVGSKRNAGAGGTDLRTRWGDIADNDEEVIFANTVPGQHCTDVETEIAGAALSGLASVKAFVDDLNGPYARRGLGLNGFDQWLSDRRLRLDAKAGAICAARYTISPKNLAGDADAGVSAPGLSLGSLGYGGTLAGAADIALTSAPSPIVLRVVTIGAADWTLTITPKRSPAATQTIAQIITGSGSGGAAGNTYVLGQEAISGTPAAGQKTVDMAATEQFKVGETVLLTEWTGTAPDEVWTKQEWGVIASIIPDTSITLEDNLLHSYTAAGFVYPCFRGMTAASGTGGNAGDAVWFGVQADRRLKG